MTGSPDNASMDQKELDKKSGVPKWVRFAVSFGLLAIILIKVDVRPLITLVAGASVPLVALSFVM
ncbi:MAG: hypothetical protein OEV92_10735, partial [Nitrospinota bacterium]|nr:hypothetical protein [Nitrospinota bacterium]